jgi:uncharacterized RDD family membrane protein YckC
MTTSGTGLPGTPAEFGPRAIAAVIDFVVPQVVLFLGFILAAIIGGTIGGLLGFLLIIGAMAFFVWNLVLQQGSTGQTLGKQKQNLKLVSDQTGQPVGAGMAFVRWFVAGAVGSATCGLYYLADYLFPLFDDPGKKRLTDKMLNFSVIQL